MIVRRPSGVGGANRNTRTTSKQTPFKRVENLLRLRRTRWESLSIDD